MNDSAPNAAAPRLNPFLFPPDTDSRFALLIVAVLGASLFAYAWLHNAFFGATYLQAVVNCQSEAETIASPDQQRRQIASCMRPTDWAMGRWILGGILLVLVTAVVIYWVIPAIKIRRNKLEPLTVEDAPEILDYLSSLCREVGFSRPPGFLLNGTNPAKSGVAFGRAGRYWIALNGGLVTQFYTDRPAFRAVVLHELAHLWNADINKTYFAVAVWRAFVLVALIPFAIGLVSESLRHPSEIHFVANVAWRILPLAALVYLTRNAVLRARELYADVRASIWDQPAGALGRVLATLPRREIAPWRRPLELHPDPGARVLALTETQRLFPLNPWDVLGAGMASGIAFANVALLQKLFFSPEHLVLANYGAALLFAPLLAGVAGLGMWRGLFAARAGKSSAQHAGRLGLILGLGLFLGQFLSFDSAVPASFQFPASFGRSDSFLYHILWGALLLAGTAGIMRWIAIGATVWLEFTATSRALRLAALLSLTIATALLAAWLGTLFNVMNLGIPGLLLATPGWLLSLVISPAGLLAFISLWAFPLSAWFRRKHAATEKEQSWAFLDSASGTLPPTDRFLLRPRFALMTGLAGGLAFSALLLFARIAISVGIPEPTRNTDRFRIGFYAVQAALAIFIQAGIALVVAARVKRIGEIHGLFAAFAGGCVMAVGLLGLNLLFGGTLNPAFAWRVFRHVVNGGALASLLIAAGISLVRRNT